MPILVAHFGDIADVDETETVDFWCKTIRQGTTERDIVTNVRRGFPLIAGELETSNLQPGPAVVAWRDQMHQITIPDVDGEVNLWPLIDAGMTVPTMVAGFVRNAGGVSRIARVTEAEIAELEQDPETFYVVMPNP
ncbi:hypothetical protein [Rhodococcus opacus]|uniref:Uncharacterized protein n=1 Tax=Rhodococcus opacus (strain B4) TaxID=632772 RepID=C1B9F2_RHOOB|nr:hypothetical protein [Rhodococcus opacus]BAH52305.1 hypothetical protein ROP_40580 [Rhodococcus opacus B4]